MQGRLTCGPWEDGFVAIGTPLPLLLLLAFPEVMVDAVPDGIEGPVSTKEYLCTPPAALGGGAIEADELEPSLPLPLRVTPPDVWLGRLAVLATCSTCFIVSLLRREVLESDVGTTAAGIGMGIGELAPCANARGVNEEADVADEPLGGLELCACCWYCVGIVGIAGGEVEFLLLMLSTSLTFFLVSASNFA